MSLQPQTAIRFRCLGNGMKIAGSFTNWNPVDLTDDVDSAQSAGQSASHHTAYHAVHSAVFLLESNKSYSYKYINGPNWEKDPNRTVFLYNLGDSTQICPIQEFNSPNEYVFHTFHVRMNNTIGEQLRQMYLFIDKRSKITMNRNLKLSNVVFSVTLLLKRNSSITYRYGSGDEESCKESKWRNVTTNNTDTEQHIEEYNNILVIDTDLLKRVIVLESSLTEPEMKVETKQIKLSKVNIIPSRTMFNKVEVCWKTIKENCYGMVVYPLDNPTFSTEGLPPKIPYLSNQSTIKKTLILHKMPTAKKWIMVRIYGTCTVPTNIPSLFLENSDAKIETAHTDDEYNFYIILDKNNIDDKFEITITNTPKQFTSESLFQFILMNDNDTMKISKEIALHFNDLPITTINQGIGEMLTVNSVFGFFMRLTESSIYDFKFLIDRSIHTTYAGRSASYRNIANAILLFEKEIIAKIIKVLAMDEKIMIGFIINRIELAFRLTELKLDQSTLKKCILNSAVTSNLLTESRQQYIIETCKENAIPNDEINDLIFKSNQIPSSFIMLHNNNVLSPQSIVIDNQLVGRLQL